MPTTFNGAIVFGITGMSILFEHYVRIQRIKEHEAKLVQAKQQIYFAIRQSDSKSFDTQVTYLESQHINLMSLRDENNLDPLAALAKNSRKYKYRNPSINDQASVARNDMLKILVTKKLVDLGDYSIILADAIRLTHSQNLLDNPKSIEYKHLIELLASGDDAGLAAEFIAKFVNPKPKGP